MVIRAIGDRDHRSTSVEVARSVGICRSVPRDVEALVAIRSVLVAPHDGRVGAVARDRRDVVARQLGGKREVDTEEVVTDAAPLDQELRTEGHGGGHVGAAACGHDIGPRPVDEGGDDLPITLLSDREGREVALDDRDGPPGVARPDTAGQGVASQRRGVVPREIGIRIARDNAVAGDEQLVGGCVVESVGRSAVARIDDDTGVGPGPGASVAIVVPVDRETSPPDMLHGCPPDAAGEPELVLVLRRGWRLGHHARRDNRRLGLTDKAHVRARCRDRGLDTERPNPQRDGGRRRDPSSETVSPHPLN
ncbi:unannotated protein [freshwater metagenome]|uniref:Unannotated protein n=1 Tax=freshwater metagenome TaxID=449393 RepID=A0A6J7KW55_9ZZZZ